jgi:hypothetical protein
MHKSEKRTGKAYAAYLTQVHRDSDSIDSFFERTDWSDPSEIMIPILERLDRMCTELIVLGPPEVAHAAHEVVNALALIGQTVEQGRPHPSNLIPQRIDEFARAAGAAIEGITQQVRLPVRATAQEEAPPA